MDSILKRLSEDKDLDWYYEIPEKEAEAYLDEILIYANANRESFIRFTRTIIPAYFCPLNVIYESLCKDPANWGDFLAEEHKRIFKAAENTAKPSQHINCLEEISFIEDKSMPFVDKIIRFLTTQLESPVDGLRHQAISLLTTWIAGNEKIKYRHVLNKIEERLTDTNWKIRWITYELLTTEFGYKKEDIKLTWIDRTKAYFNSVFGSPYSID